MIAPDKCSTIAPLRFPYLSLAANLEGTIFKISSRGTLTTLHSFNSTDGSSSGVRADSG
jgi:hypothetical protein